MTRGTARALGGGTASAAFRAATPGAMGMTGVAAPPFLLPGAHFTAALGFLVLGAAGLVGFADQFAVGGFPSPRVIAVAHLFTLGWITTSIMGALYQFLPVALGQPIRSVRLAYASLLIHVIGLPLFVAGLLLGHTGALMSGAVGLAAALLIFIGNLAASLAAASRRGMTWWALSGAAFFLAVTLVLGVTLAGDLRWGYLGAARFDTVGMHLHVALGGWVLLVIVGVADHLLPMFLLSHGAGEVLPGAAAALLAAGAAALVAFHHGPLVLGRWLPALLMGGGLACFLVQAARQYRKRSGPRSTRACGSRRSRWGSWRSGSCSRFRWSRGGPARSSRRPTCSCSSAASACSWPRSSTRSFPFSSGSTASARSPAGDRCRKSPTSSMRRPPALPEPCSRSASWASRRASFSAPPWWFARRRWCSEPGC